MSTSDLNELILSTLRDLQKTQLDMVQRVASIETKLSSSSHEARIKALESSVSDLDQTRWTAKGYLIAVCSTASLLSAIFTGVIIKYLPFIGLKIG